MQISFDPVKREKTLRERGLDFATDPAEVFAGPRTVTIEDARFTYAERRFQTVGFFEGRIVMVVWTPRENDTRHIISMRKCNAREQEKFGRALGQD